jgi:mevalonate kinase
LAPLFALALDPGLGGACCGVFRLLQPAGHLVANHSTGACENLILPPARRAELALRELGELMHQSWQIKRELASSVSNSQIDDIYEAGRDAGAVGGKLLGAGGGGFMVLLVDPEKRAQVRERLRKLIHVNVGFDTDGSKIAIYQPDEV